MILASWKIGMCAGRYECAAVSSSWARGLLSQPAHCSARAAVNQVDGNSGQGDAGHDGLAERVARAVRTRDVEGYEVARDEAHRLGIANAEGLEQLEQALVREIDAGVQWPDPPGLHPTAPILLRLGKPGVLAFLRAYEPALNRRPVRMFYGAYFKWGAAQGEDPYGFLMLGWPEAEALLGLVRDRTNPPGLRYGAGEVLSYAPAAVSVLAMVPLLEMMNEVGDESSEARDPRSRHVRRLLVPLPHHHAAV